MDLRIVYLNLGSSEYCRELEFGSYMQAYMSKVACDTHCKLIFFRDMSLDCKGI